jgi:hypothetical protein
MPAHSFGLLLQSSNTMVRSLLLKSSEQVLKLFDLQRQGNALPLSALPHVPHRVGSFDSGKKFMSHTVAKNRAHDVADPDFGASCQWLLFIVGGIADQTVQPVLNRDDVARPSIYCPKGISLSFSPCTRNVVQRLRALSPMVFDHHREHSEGLKKLLTKGSHSYRIKP